jgi:predicted nucleotide-binding protein (sugar kinase/HSP70/actin superfamily)
MVKLIKSGTPNIAYVQPFACLPNHVTGKGMIKELRVRFPQSNIAAIYTMRVQQTCVAV